MNLSNQATLNRCIDRLPLPLAFDVFAAICSHPADCRWVASHQATIAVFPEGEEYLVAIDRRLPTIRPFSVRAKKGRDGSYVALEAREYVTEGSTVVESFVGQGGEWGDWRSCKFPQQPQA